MKQLGANLLWENEHSLTVQMKVQMKILSLIMILSPFTEYHPSQTRKRALQDFWLQLCTIQCSFVKSIFRIS